ncbi:hypothetical protein GCM10023231_01740 [Olivibacter ginsenosidimutans]|uniref:Uncharacterized protein n=1 Tax=Olivibacter ginsenosidimutans TaxID=1176537 RepID=A0ABP9AC95_9SPHI
MLKAASYNKGGRNKSIMISGLISIAGIAGTKPIAIPTSSNSNGIGNLILSATADAIIMMAIIIRTMV